jgi:ElaB/YqjD/DUF883 family membrane-anchored ribosome-binding protein
MFTATTKDDDLDDMKSASQTMQNGDLRAAANKAGRTVRNYFDAACDEVSHGTETVTTQIRQKPVQSSMIALGLGFVLGALFRR